MGSRAARRLQPGDIVEFTCSLPSMAPTDWGGQRWTVIPKGTVGLVIPPPPRDGLDPTGPGIDWTIVLVDGEPLWLSSLTIGRCKRLNRRAP